jgi:hypothetical protein
MTKNQIPKDRGSRLYLHKKLLHTIVLHTHKEAAHFVLCDCVYLNGEGNSISRPCGFISAWDLVVREVESCQGLRWQLFIEIKNRKLNLFEGSAFAMAFIVFYCVNLYFHFDIVTKNLLCTSFTTKHAVCMDVKDETE